jgi:hypothetical protein
LFNWPTTGGVTVVSVLSSSIEDGVAVIANHGGLISLAKDAGWFIEFFPI